ncbi:phosphatase PAP2 family protein [Butyrivibrio sp. LC3010]|uniref:phosphatase PAP2 family protein n=1 Tax=Butyrivibrio sp. LC3010 TaxID=1280680 RepID=UPI0003F72DB0|nr:phosphatase PAP2 family protein [Butyrivibrio sp. LC3010]
MIDIQYLLWLQEIRNATGGLFDEFFNSISKVAVDIMPFLPFFIFWAVDRKWGYRALMTLGVGELINGVIKLTVCAYRPWIRSDLIEPAGDSKVAATGYSFPSGHTMSATCTYGTTFAWQRNKRTWLAVICAVLIALTGFSRNFLGVHTPQDVIVGFTEAVIIICIVGAVQKKIDGNEKTLDILSVVGVIAVILTLIYITQKPYPMDYVDGVLLVDPGKMMNDSFKACGAFIGLLIGSYVERHYIKYEIPVGAKDLPILSFVGFMIAFSWKEYFAPATIVAVLGGHWGHFISRCILWFFVVAIWPIVIQKVCNYKVLKDQSEKYV